MVKQLQRRRHFIREEIEYFLPGLQESIKVKKILKTLLYQILLQQRTDILEVLKKIIISHGKRRQRH